MKTTEMYKTALFQVAFIGFYGCLVSNTRGSMSRWTYLQWGGLAGTVALDFFRPKLEEKGDRVFGEKLSERLWACAPLVIVGGAQWRATQCFSTAFAAGCLFCFSSTVSQTMRLSRARAYVWDETHCVQKNQPRTYIEKNVLSQEQARLEKINQQREKTNIRKAGFLLRAQCLIRTGQFKEGKAILQKRLGTYGWSWEDEFLKQRLLCYAENGNFSEMIAEIKTSIGSLEGVKRTDSQRLSYWKTMICVCVQVFQRGSEGMQKQTSELQLHKILDQMKEELPKIEQEQLEKKAQYNHLRNPLKRIHYEYEYRFLIAQSYCHLKNAASEKEDRNRYAKAVIDLINVQEIFCENPYGEKDIDRLFQWHLDSGIGKVLKLYIKKQPDLTGEELAKKFNNLTYNQQRFLKEIVYTLKVLQLVQDKKDQQRKEPRESLNNLMPWINGKELHKRILEALLKKDWWKNPNVQMIKSCVEKIGNLELYKNIHVKYFGHTVVFKDQIIQRYHKDVPIALNMMNHRHATIALDFAKKSKDIEYTLSFLLRFFYVSPHLNSLLFLPSKELQGNPQELEYMMQGKQQELECIKSDHYQELSLPMRIAIDYCLRSSSAQDLKTCISHEINSRKKVLAYLKLAELVDITQSDACLLCAEETAASLKKGQIQAFAYIDIITAYLRLRHWDDSKPTQKGKISELMKLIPEQYSSNLADCFTSTGGAMAIRFSNVPAKSDPYWSDRQVIAQASDLFKQGLYEKALQALSSVTLML